MTTFYDKIATVCNNLTERDMVTIATVATVYANARVKHFDPYDMDARYRSYPVDAKLEYREITGDDELIECCRGSTEESRLIRLIGLFVGIGASKRRLEYDWKELLTIEQISMVAQCKLVDAVETEQHVYMQLREPFSIWIRNQYRLELLETDGLIPTEECNWYEACMLNAYFQMEVVPGYKPKTAFNEWMALRTHKAALCAGGFID